MDQQTLPWVVAAGYPTKKKRDKALCKVNKAIMKAPHVLSVFRFSMHDQGCCWGVAVVGEMPAVCAQKRIATAFRKSHGQEEFLSPAHCKALLKNHQGVLDEIGELEPEPLF